MQNYYETSKNPVDVLRIELNKLRQKWRSLQDAQKRKIADSSRAGYPQQNV